MDDPEIQQTVESILGKGVKVVDCEKKSSIREEEVLFINGIPVVLEGHDGLAIKQALITGQVPPCDLLNTLLIKTGILKAPVKLDTSLSVKSTTVTKEEVAVSRDGRIVDEHSVETKECNVYTSAMSEVFQPAEFVPPNAGVERHQPPKAAVIIPGKCHPSSSMSSSSSSSSNNHTMTAFCDNTTVDSSDDATTRPAARLYTHCPSATRQTGAAPAKNNHVTSHSCLSKDSGHLSGNSTCLSSSSGDNKQFCPSSLDSLSSLDDVTLSDRFQTHTIGSNNTVNTNKNCQKNSNNSIVGTEHGNGNTVETFSTPTIFGTVASDATRKDCSNKKTLPQTPQSKTFSNKYKNGNDWNKSVEPNIHEDNALVYRDGNLVSGSLEALIQHMVPTDVYYPDRAYLFAFLLSSRLFIKPHDLLCRIRNVYDLQRGSDTATDAKITATQMKFAENLIQVLTEWTETFPYDFRDERVMQYVRIITQECCSVNAHLRSSVSALLHNLLQKLTALEAFETFLDSCSKFLENSHCSGGGGGDVFDTCPLPETLAQQLTHVELERLSFIGPEEFVQAFAKENPHLETSFKDMKKTRNLEQYVQWFNRLSYFVATQVCKHPKKKQRVKIVEYWIETGRECFNIGNFNSLMAIIAGLNMSPISRLKKTWSKIHSGKFAILEHQMDPTSNFSSYRSTLKAAMWRSAGAKNQRQRIVIPFFSLLVKDLYFLNQGCSNKLPNGHINFEKFWQLAKQVTEFMAWKQVTCPFDKEAKVIDFLQKSTILTENALALASFECEPPENNQEKERCKSLKAADSSVT